MLVPRTDSIPIFQGTGMPEYMREEFERYRCREQQVAYPTPEPSDICKKYIFSIGAIIQEQALRKSFSPESRVVSPVFQRTFWLAFFKCPLQFLLKSIIFLAFWFGLFCYVGIAEVVPRFCGKIETWKKSRLL